MSYQLIDLKNELISNSFTTYPMSVFEDNNVKMKRMKILKEPSEVVWEYTYKVLASFKDFEFISNTVFTNKGLYSLVELYAKVDVEIQEFKRRLQSQKQYQEIVQFYELFNNILNIKLFDIFVNDMEKLILTAKERYNQDKDKYGDLQNEICDETIENIKSMYKNEIKKAKNKG